MVARGLLAASLLLAVPLQGVAFEEDSAELDGVHADVNERLESIVRSIPAIGDETRLRRNIAQATFCLPQNVLGVLFYGLLDLTGQVLRTAEVNEATLVVVHPALGVSLGRFIFLPDAFLTEANVRHEYGHTLQGYRHGPFYLPLVGVTSFVQAAMSIFSPAYAARYFDRWPEDEANELGGV